MHLIDFIIQNPYFDVAVASALTYIVRLFFSPSKGEVKVVGKIIVGVAMFCINLLRRWYLKHPDTVGKKLDHLYAQVFHSKHYFKGHESDKIVVG